MLKGGWAAACAVDIPGSYVIARWIFGRHPAVPFLLLLAISADYFLLWVQHRLTPKGLRLSPAQIHDVKAAIRWARRRSSRLKPSG